MPYTRTTVVTVVAGACLWLAPSAGAASPSQEECEAAGGTFSKTNGTVSCVIATSDPVGNSEASGGKSQTRDTTTTSGGQGNLDNKETRDTQTSGPGNSQG